MSYPSIPGGRGLWKAGIVSLYRHSQLEHRHVHRYQDKRHDYAYHKNQQRFGYTVELPDFVFEPGVGIVRLGQKHLFKGIGLLSDFQQNEETFAVQILMQLHTVCQVPALFYHPADFPY